MKELPKLSRATSTGYELSNGARMMRLSSGPINFKDANGKWRDLDPTLVVAAKPGVYRAAQLPFGVSIASETNELAPVTLRNEGHELAINLVGLDEVSPKIDCSEASFREAAPRTSVNYSVRDNGVEQTVVLTAADAANTFTCKLTHPGLTMRRDGDGVWGFYEKADGDPVFAMGGLSVFDSSSDGDGQPEFCEAAKMIVDAGQDSSTLTYVVPRDWLADPRREYPVLIDPTYYAGYGNPQGGDAAAFPDTFVSRANPDDRTQGHSSYMRTGKGSGTWAYTRSLVRFDVSHIPSGVYIASARVQICRYQYVGTGTAPIVGYLTGAPAGWVATSSWNDLGLEVAGLAWTAERSS